MTKKKDFSETISENYDEDELKELQDIFHYQMQYTDPKDIVQFCFCEDCRLHRFIGWLETKDGLKQIDDIPEVTSEDIDDALQNGKKKYEALMLKRLKLKGLGLKPKLTRVKN